MNMRMDTQRNGLQRFFSTMKIKKKKNVDERKKGNMAIENRGRGSGEPVDWEA